MQERFGKFEVVRLLGRGAMGEVFLAKDPALGRSVAIKTIQAGSTFGEEARLRFEREARVTGTLPHPNIVTVYEFGEQDGLHFLAMEYVEGDTLEQALASGALDVSLAVEALAQVSEALAFAHEHGVIHRDVKPANILIRQKGRRLTAKLMDFGVATVDQSSLTQQGIWMGTVNYMAPEYLDTGRATPSSDLFAVGVMLYEVLTGGRRPFAGETTTTVLNAILRAAPVPLTPDEIHAAGVKLTSVLLKSLSKRPEDRYPDGDQLAEALREAVMARPRAAAAEEPVPEVPPAGETLPPVVPAPPPVPAAPVPPMPAPSAPPPPAPRPAAPAAAPSPVAAAPEAPVHPTTRVDRNSRSLVVGRGGAGTVLSLRVGLRQLEPGGTLKVLPGTYRESLVVDKPVRIVAEGGPEATVLEGAGPLLVVQCEGVEVVGLGLLGELDIHPLLKVVSGSASLTGCRLLGRPEVMVEVRGPGSRLSLHACEGAGTGSTAVLVAGGGEVEVRGGRWDGFRRAVFLGQEGALVRLDQVHIGPGAGVGVWVRSGARAQLSDCRVEGRESSGIEADGSATVDLSGGAVEGSALAGILALQGAQVRLDRVRLAGHGAAAVHLEGDVRLQALGCQLRENGGYGMTLRSGATATLEETEVVANGFPGLHLGAGCSAQVKGCAFLEGRSVGVVCARDGRGVLEQCTISGNAQSGARVEPGGSILLLRCTIKEGQDTGLMVFQDAEATLEQCVVHRNARGGILLARDASDPVIRDAGGIEDDLFRINAAGEKVKVVPLR